MWGVASSPAAIPRRASWTCPPLTCCATTGAMRTPRSRWRSASTARWWTRGRSAWATRSSPREKLHTGRMDHAQARELLASARARIERTLDDQRVEEDQDPDPFEASDAGPDLYDEELGEGRAEKLREELE